jgi:diguanylate cyclase (GGDEF)-like protein/PAS domain S-box-containing protein
MTMNYSLNRKMQGAFSLAMLVMLLMGAASYRWMLLLDESNWWARHTHEVLDNLNDLQSSMESASRSYRDFVLTGEESYLTPYHASVSIAQRDEANVRSLTVDNPLQQKELPKLESLLAKKLRIADEVIDLRRAKGFEVAAQAVRSGTGLQTMDQFQSTLTDMKGEELRLLAGRQAEAKRRALQTKSIIVIGMLLALVIAAGAGWSVRRESAARDLAQEAQREGEDRFRNLANNISQLAWMADDKGRSFWYNERWFEYCGTTPEKLSGLGWKKVVHPDHLDRILEALNRGFRSGETWEHTFPLRGKDGTYRMFLGRVVPIRDAEGKLLRWVGTNTDITELLNSEKHVAQMEERYRGLLEAAPDAMVVVNPSGEIILLNLQAEKQFEYTRDELVGQNVKTIIPNGFAERLIADALRSEAEALAQQMGTGIELLGRRKDGTEFPIEIMLSPLESAEGTLITGAIRNITTRKKVEAALFVEKELAQVTLNCISDAIACTDSSGNITFLNVAAEVITGWPMQEAAGRPLQDIFHILDATSRETIPKENEVAVGQNRTLRLPSNCILVRRDGFEIPIEDSIAPIHDRGGLATGAVIVFRDVSVARAMALQIAHSAEHDFLTGLPNRLLLYDRIHQAIAAARSHNKKVALAFLDLDGFKHINDSLGHPVGDKLLQSVAKRLENCVRASDTVSRQGGDEFIILLSEVENLNESAVAVRKILEAVAGTYSIDENDLHVTTSIGVSIYPEDGMDAETLIKNADTAMYQAKENGRQCYRFFEPAMNVQAVERQSIEENLRRALQLGEFILHYQPKINLATGEISGAEALIRWMHPTRGMVPPAQFIPIAEDCGLILPISRWVLREACKQAQAWAYAGLPRISMAVNISATDFRNESFLESVFSVLEETGLDPSLLELELTESVLMKRAEAAEFNLRALRAKGIRLAVDDFGTGYSSLSYLRQFSIDSIKIDQSFIRQLSITPNETTILTAMIYMGQSLKLRVVAEGVETAKQLAFLQGRECDEAQGYYFSRPVLPEQFAKLLEERAFLFSPFELPRPA